MHDSMYMPVSCSLGAPQYAHQHLVRDLSFFLIRKHMKPSVGSSSHCLLHLQRTVMEPPSTKTSSKLLDAPHTLPQPSMSHLRDSCKTVFQRLHNFLISKAVISALPSKCPFLPAKHFGTFYLTFPSAVRRVVPRKPVFVRAPGHSAPC